MWNNISQESHPVKSFALTILLSEFPSNFTMFFNPQANQTVLPSASFKISFPAPFCSSLPLRIPIPDTSIFKILLTQIQFLFFFSPSPSLPVLRPFTSWLSSLNSLFSTSLVIQDSQFWILLFSLLNFFVTLIYMHALLSIKSDSFFFWVAACGINDTVLSSMLDVVTHLESRVLYPRESL